MGGYGSGQRYNRKTTVEECWALDAARLAKQGAIPADRGVGYLWWTNSRTGERTLTVEYYVDELGDGGAILNLYSTLDSRGNKLEIKEPVSLVTTRPQFGGVRWWFICPLSVNGVPCERRVRKLYLPPSTKYFGCRHCYRLTYQSVQEHDKRVDHYVKNIPALMWTLEHGSWQTKLSASRAAFKIHGLL